MKLYYSPLNVECIDAVFAVNAVSAQACLRPLRGLVPHAPFDA